MLNVAETGFGDVRTIGTDDVAAVGLAHKQIEA
jgi:hypothetical protein